MTRLAVLAPSGAKAASWAPHPSATILRGRRCGPPNTIPPPAVAAAIAARRGAHAQARAALRTPRSGWSVGPPSLATTAAEPKATQRPSWLNLIGGVARRE